MTNVIQKRVVTNLDRCIECGSCAAACHVSHADFPAVCFAISGAARLPLICRQCKDAPCVIACPVEAMVQDACGVARRRLFRCIGCGSCARACPFGVLPGELSGVPAGYQSPRITGHQIPKCDLCYDRTEHNPDAVPRCVAACPAGALLYVDEHEAKETGVAPLGARTTGENPYKRR